MQAGLGGASVLTKSDSGRGRTAAGDPIVEIGPGKIRGVTAEGVHTFKGIPYGASTSGKNRFMPPRKPEPWAGIRNALTLQGRSPQHRTGPQRPELVTLWGPVDELPVGEDCLTLHVWTPGLDAAKRPVMVWLHGGAFSFGSANALRFDGTNLARRQDVVVVTVNHRLNIFGHLHLAEIGGEAFARSGNAGVLDLIAALEWVRDNVGQLGGDPGNVTIFGQSGGGGKVSVLLSMPKARGLFHRGIIQSGATIRVAERERATMLAEAVLKQVGLGPSQFEELQALPIDRLLAAIDPAVKTLPPARQPLLDRYPFGPVVDGEDLPRQPFDPAAPDISDDIPLLIGDTKDETAIFLAPDDKVWDRSLTEDELRSRVRAVAGESTDRMIETYRGRHPGMSPAELLIAITTDSNFRVRSLMLADRKAAKPRARVWFYSLDWHTPVYDGRLKAPHSLDTPLVFDTADRIGPATAGPQAQALATRMSTTWAAFARSGKPDNPAIPHWPAYGKGDRPVMVFDDECRVETISETDPRHEWGRVAQS